MASLGSGCVHRITQDCLEKGEQVTDDNFPVIGGTLNMEKPEDINDSKSQKIYNSIKEI